MATKVIHSDFCLMFTGDQQQMLKTQLTDSGTLSFYLIFVQRFAFDTVAHGKAAVGAVVGAKVREIQRNIKADRVAEALPGQALRSLCQRLQKVGGGRGEQRHQIVATKL